MDQEMLKRRLAEAEGHIATGDKNIAASATSSPNWNVTATIPRPQQPSYMNSNNCRPST
jgi:hypothetical protein